MNYYCPITQATWSAHTLDDDAIVNQTDMTGPRFQNDELQLENMKTYYTVVELVDAINRTYFAKSDGFLTLIEPPNPGDNLLCVIGIANLIPVVEPFSSVYVTHFRHIFFKFLNGIL